MRTTQPVRGFVLTVCAVFALGLEPAVAGSIQWGVWGKPPERTRANKSYLGASQAAKAAEAAKRKSATRKVVAQAPRKGRFLNGFKRGSVVIDTSRKRLYYTLSNKKAYIYPIAVGRRGFKWTGVEKVSRIASWPDWIPPPEMRKRQPYLPKRVRGGPRNPLGAKAIYLGDTLYRIHGTNSPRSIGTASSSGCFRMHNRHVLHLAKLVDKGTTVYVMDRLPRKGRAMPPPEPEVVPEEPELIEAKATSGETPAAANATGTTSAKPSTDAAPAASDADPAPKRRDQEASNGAIRGTQSTEASRTSAASATTTGI